MEVHEVLVNAVSARLLNHPLSKSMLSGTLHMREEGSFGVKVLVLACTQDHSHPCVCCHLLSVGLRPWMAPTLKYLDVLIASAEQASNILLGSCI